MLVALVPRTCLALAGIVAAAGAVGAQPAGPPALPDSVARAAAPAAAEARVACFRPRPRAACRGFVVVEAGVYPRLAGTEAPRPWGARRQLGNHASWELGYMVNTGSGSALGATAVVGLSGAGARWGAKARYRRWLPGEFAADLGAGPVSAEVAVPVPRTAADAPSFAHGLGATADVGVSWRGTVGLGVRADAVRARGTTARAVYAGVQLGSGAAVGGTAAAVLAVGAMIGALAYGGGG